MLNNKYSLFLGTQGRRMKMLTRDTSIALEHTCNGLVEMARHLLHTTHSYVLLGSFTTDPLGKAFGKLRKGSGGTYFINVQQILEKVNINKTKLLLQLNVDINSFNVESGHSCARCHYMLSEGNCEIFDKLPNLEQSINDDVKNALIYIAGYVIRKDVNIVEDSTNYFDKYGKLTAELNRGGLCVPGDAVCQWVIFCYIMFNNVSSNVCRLSLCNLMMLISETYGFNMERVHGNILANIFLNNYCYLYTPVSDKEPKQKVLKLSY